MSQPHVALAAAGSAELARSVDHFSLDTLLETVRSRAAGHPVRLALAAAAEDDSLAAVTEAARLGIVMPILVGNEAAIRRVAAEGEIDITGCEIVHVEHDEDGNRTATTAVKLVSSGRADMLMKGLVDTSVLLKAILDRDTGLRNGDVLSHLALFEIEDFDRPLFLTDAAMNIAPDVDAKQAIIENAVAFMHLIGYERPAVALLAAKEKVSPKMQATVDAWELVERHQQGAMGGCLVDGPFALDNAVSQEAAATKGIRSPIAGLADLLVAPQIESGNVLYKALTFLARSRSAGVIVGARAPIVLTSRADSSRTKLDSIALAARAAG